MSYKGETGWLLFGLCITVALSTVFYSSFSLNHDSSWYLIATRMFLDGGLLYRDIIEINPPLAFYITIPALVFADLFNLGETLAFFFYVSALGGFSVAWVYFIARRAGLEKFAVLLVTAFAFVACFILAMPDFGQREHLMLIFAMPYFAYLWFRDRLKKLSRGEQCAVGLFAFFGLGLKPYFLLFPAGIILFAFVQSRKVGEFINIPNISLVVALIVYLAFIVLIHPLYLVKIVPTASLIYSAYGRDDLAVLLRAETFAFLSVSILAIACWKQFDRVSVSMFGGMIGATAVYLIQYKGWNYHLFPVSLAIFTTSAWVVFSAFDKVRSHVALGVLAFVSIAISIGAQLKQGPYSARTSDEFAAYVGSRGEAIMVFSTNVSASFPFINEVGADWTSRYPTQWLLPGAFSRLANTDCMAERLLCSRISELVASTRSNMVDDFAKGRPALVFIDKRDKKDYFGNIRFDYLEFLQQDRRFALLWHDYRKVGEAKQYDVYALNRTPGA